MTLELARESAGLRFLEVRRSVAVIKRLESTSPLVADDSDVVALRGLFYVHLYGAFEYSITTAVQEFLRRITASQVKFADLQYSLFSVALNPEWMSIQDSKRGTFKKRLLLLQKQQAADVCALNETVFDHYLQNIWFENLEMIFKCFSLSDDVVPNMAFRGYIDEVADKRNRVAHGRHSAFEVGSGTRSDELAIRLDAISNTVEHVFSCFTRAATGLEFIERSKRSNYVRAE